MMYDLRDMSVQYRSFASLFVTVIILRCLVPADFDSFAADKEKILRHFASESTRGIQKPTVTKYSGFYRGEVVTFLPGLHRSADHSLHNPHNVPRGQSKFLQGQIYTSTSSSFL